jgi:hypothetical protein
VSKRIGERRERGHEQGRASRNASRAYRKRGPACGGEKVPFPHEEYLEFSTPASPEFSCRLEWVIKQNTQSHKPTTEVSILLTSDQIAQLDQVAIVIRRRTGRALSRSAMIRAIITPVLQYHPHWLNCESERQLQQTVANQLIRGNQ